MTAEVAFLNQRGVALAADSAVTLSNNKVFNNATKLFTLDSEHYIGIMIYGNADLGQVPWEVIIKLYREKLGNDVKNTVSDYAKDLMNFIENLSFFDLSKQDSVFVSRYFYECVNILKSDISEIYQEGMDFNEIFTKILHVNFQFERDETIKNFNVEEAIYERNSVPNLKQEIKKIWPEINDSSSNDFIKLLWKIMTSADRFSSAMTGLVVSGYGKDEAFPSIYNYSIDGFFQEKLKYVLKNESIINDSLDGNSSTMIPFAQSDVINTLIHGIDDRLGQFRKTQSNNLKDAIKNIPVNNTPNYQNVIEALFMQNENAFNQYVEQNFNIPFNEMNSVLSLEELATMAETFISLTSFKRKFSNALESVGGPIDVLVISRGDGPIWVNRKRYFELEMNQGYVQRRK